MAGKVNVIGAPPARRVDTATGSFSFVSAPGAGPPMGPPTPRLATTLATVTAEVQPLPVGEQDDAWAREVARREANEATSWAADGLMALPPTRVSGGVQPTPVYYPADPVFHELPTRDPPDLTGLPDRFTLEIGRKADGWWIVTAPAHHVGLFVANQDLLAALNDAPGALAQILRLDGAQPKVAKRGRRSKA
jgi:hypothetical protein